MGKRKKTRVSEEEENQGDFNPSSSSSSTEKSLYEVLNGSLRIDEITHLPDLGNYQLSKQFHRLMFSPKHD